jgi:RimJ/RimL family protein N-acetyltransferase
MGRGFHARCRKHSGGAAISGSTHQGDRLKGYGTDVVGVLRHCGFVVRGLRRLQIETLSDNAAMLRSAERDGFVREGVLRSPARPRCSGR